MRRVPNCNVCWDEGYEVDCPGCTVHKQTITVHYQLSELQPSLPDSPGMGECAAEEWENIKRLMFTPPNTPIAPCQWIESTAKELLVEAVGNLLKYALLKQYDIRNAKHDNA